MKPRLPSLLVAAIVTLQTGYLAKADYVGSGICYDTGKEHYSTSEAAQKGSDSDMCWAVAGSNAMQYWQDTYYQYAEEGTPNGYSSEETQEKYRDPYGTRYLAIYEQVRTSMTQNRGGLSSEFFDWWFKGIEEGTPLNKVSGYENGYYTTLFSEEKTNKAFTGTNINGEAISAYNSALYVVDGTTYDDAYVRFDCETFWSDFSDFIKKAFTVQGQAVTLDLNYGHAINCWGYETDESGKVSALILSDGDDQQFGTFRVTLSLEEADTLSTGDYEVVYGERLVLKTDDNSEIQLHAGYLDDTIIKAWISGAYYIDTPDTDELSTLRELKSAKSSITSGETLSENTRLTDDLVVEGKGITVGGVVDEKINAVVLTSGSGVKLSLNGETNGIKDSSTGMTVTQGGMVSLENVTIKNYGGDGINNQTKVYLHDGDVKITDNDGYGIKSSNYTELQDCTSVTISGNAQGGIKNEAGTVSIRGNEVVVFENSGNGKNDIYNAAGARFNISDNDSVKFKGNSETTASNNVAVVNAGELYISAEEDKKVTFENSTLETTGKTYIGTDVSSRSADTAGSVYFTSMTGGDMSISANVHGSYATLENLAINADLIMSAGDNVGTLTNAMITVVDSLTLSGIAMNSTDVVTAQGGEAITLSNVTIALTTSDYVDGKFDLTGMFTGNYVLSTVTFDLTGVELPTSVSDSDLYFDLSNAYSDKEHMSIYVKRGETAQAFAYADNVYLAETQYTPEPTTGTLSLLALAGLCARRRRR